MAMAGPERQVNLVLEKEDETDQSPEEQEGALHCMYWGRCMLRAPLATSHGVVTCNDMIRLVKRAAEWR